MGAGSPRGRRAPASVLALVLLVALSAGGTSAAPPPAGPPASGAEVGSPAWTFSRLAEADALLRRGKPRAAARAFKDVFVNSQGTQWATLAELGLAWSVATGGDLAYARALARDAHASAGIASSATSVVFGLLSAKAGDYAAALDGLDSGLRTAAPSEANVIRLAKAYVLFWSGQLDRAAAEFDAVANADRKGALADDARYGAAWSRLEAGDRPRATSELVALVQDAPPGFVFRSVPRRLVVLDEHAILGDNARRYKRGGIQAADAQLARLLDSDGFSRARSALKWLDAESDPSELSGAGARSAAAPGLDEAAAPDGYDVASAPQPRPAPPAPAKHPGAGVERPAARGWLVLTFVLVLIALAVGLAWARRGRATRASARSRNVLPPSARRIGS